MQPKKTQKTNSWPNRAVWTVFVNCAHWRGSTLAIYKTVLIIFPLNLQIITITLDVVKWRWGIATCDKMIPSIHTESYVSEWVEFNAPPTQYRLFWRQRANIQMITLQYMWQRYEKDCIQAENIHRNHRESNIQRQKRQNVQRRFVMHTIHKLTNTIT